MKRRDFLAGMAGSSLLPLHSAVCGPVGFRVPKSPFSMSEIASLWCWLDSSQITGLVDTDPVGSFPDASGNGNDVSQGDSAKRPVYRTAIQNGLPVVRFDGANDWLQGVWNVDVDAITLFSVLSRGAGNVPLSLSNNVDDYNSAAYLEAFRDGNNGFGAYRNNASLLGANWSSGIKILIQVFDGSVLKLWSNGVRTTDRASVGTFASTHTTVGAGVISSAKTAFLNGDLCEMGIYKTAATSEQIYKLNAHLNSKWRVY